MNTMKIKILFYIQKSKMNASSKCPLACRITYNYERKEFSSGLYIPPKYWDNKNQKAKPPNEENDFINTELSLIKSKINKAFLLLQVQDGSFTVEDIYRAYKGNKPVKETGTVEYYSQYLIRYQKLINIEIKQATWDKFNYIKNDVVDFVKWKFQKSDIPLKELDFNFITEFEYYLKTEKLHQQITINKSLQRFKKVIKTAVNNKLLDSFPFIEHKPKPVKHTITYLTTEELHLLEKHVFTQNRLAEIRDMFIFCCYTGLAYKEMSILESKHIVKGFDGNEWIKMKREKTQKEISIPLLPKSANIIGRYRNIYNVVRLLPVISNQKFNSYLKEIAAIVGIEKNLTHHIARKTFATTVLLYNDVPMEIVSELLGHSKITITQEHYAKVVDKKVSEQMIKLGRKLEG
ncbi:site-specific integrase [Elizabethkingia sp. M8]|uniref:site-specific integrase n=1 Tax=Elizabethkingia sp. M8 TaxID=2796140 RepID=UPI0019054EFE|nr:site-specific integrase [Elizabethkingia sp. M8]QQM28695.1 site-specific integrase [Elizabethkingia sp. M8]